MSDDEPVERRAFLGTAVGAAGLGALASFGAATAEGAQPGGAQPGSAQLSNAEKANRQIVADFCAAWATRDLSTIMPFLADDAVYRMSETTPPVIGHAGVRERLGSWLETSQQIEFRILDTFARGPMVINHRIDRFISTTRPLTWEGVGVFFVKDGKIKEWMDYTIRVERPPA
jgi:limonene-1,2-epoxide hydrolase